MSSVEVISVELETSRMLSMGIHRTDTLKRACAYASKSIRGYHDTIELRLYRKGHPRQASRHPHKKPKDHMRLKIDERTAHARAKNAPVRADILPY